jgi:hypothetical protein
VKKKASLNPKIIYLFFVLAFGIARGQSLDLGLSKANCQKYSSSLFIYGFSNNSKAATFRIYRSNFQLKVLDSIILPQNSVSDDYLQTYSDTLHGFLNIYLQKKEKKLVTILRFNKNFELLATIENVDIARLNSISGFDNELFYFKKSVYSIKTVKDSSGQQFYLNKYNLKAEDKNFEYQLTWQFPFERKNINSAHIFYADYKQVLLYVHVKGDTKKGQWILKLNAITGQLIRGIKLNEPGEEAVYEFGNFINDTLKKTLILAGQKILSRQWKEGDKQPNLNNATAIPIYLVQIDSLAEVTERNIFNAPLLDVKQGAKKTGNAYILRIAGIKRNAEDKLFLEADLFKSTDNLQSFTYANSHSLVISQGEEQLVLEKCTLSLNPLIEKYFIVPDKLDINGKLFNDSLGQFEKLYYKSMTFPVKQDFKVTADGNPIWLLKKSYAKKNTVNFSTLAPVNKLYKLNTVQDFLKSTEPQYTGISDSFFILSHQSEETKFSVKLFSW